MKEHLDRFPARLPPDLKKALSERAEALGKSMNDLVVLGVRNVLEATPLDLTPSAVEDAHEDLVVLTIEGEIGPAKGIAGHYAELHQHNLSALLYWMASRMQTDPRLIATELVRSADGVRKRSSRIAKALLKSALEYNPASDVAKSRLGQLLYFEGDYAGAIELLDRVREDDNYAKLFHGWATLELALREGGSTVAAREEIVVAMRRWALGQRSPENRERWLANLARLWEHGPDFERLVADLVSYANDNSSWALIKVEDAVRSERALRPNAEPNGARE
ncbi:MAG: tetratricopeptide repeat protein [Planctomycetes bacterium]|nr:tetratricopeptide repeat protein [Planctomycetota bacterium]